jgi:hypothetical protein
VWPGWPGKIRSKTQFNQLTFVFLLKRYRFDFKKKIDPNDLVIQSKLGTRTLDRAGSKNYVSKLGFVKSLQSQFPIKI